MTIGSRRVRLEFSSLSTTRVVNNSRFFADHRWGAGTLATAGAFLAIDAMQAATYQPPVYNYGVNVVYQGDDVYVDGKRTASATEYGQQAITLADEPAAQPPAPPAELVRTRPP